MTDPSQLTDAQLLAIIGQPPAAAPAPAPRPAAPAARPSQPRGLRNNNPGNIEDGAFARSLPGYAGSDGRFARFSTPDAGAQAAPRLLKSYLERGFDTPAEIINRWAPPSDNNPTAAYASYVASRVGIGPNDPVSPEQIPLVAQAISEFENGNTVGGAASASAAPADLTALSDEAILAAAQGSPLDDLSIHRPDMVDMDAAARLDDRPTTYTGPGSSEGNPFVLRENDNSREYREALQSLTKGMYVQTPEGVRRLSGDPYINANVDPNDARVGQAVLREENLADQARAFTMATAEQIPFLDETAVGAAGLLSGRGYSDVRDSYRAVQDIDNQVNRGQRVAGGFAGAGLTMVAPGVGQAGNFIRAGAAGLGQTARAAAVGGGAGALFGAGNTDGGLGERVQGGLLGAAVGAATGGLLDAGGQRAAQQATRAVSSPSAQRLLSREGVQLTPGQMLEPTPVIGPMLRGLEDGLTGVPIAGAVVQGARNRGVESFNVAALNRALAPIGQTLPAKVKPGYEAVEEVQNRLGAAYAEVLPQVSAQLDQALYDDISRVLVDAAAEMPEDRLQQLGRVLQNRVFRNVDQSDATISGEQFKRIESELGALARQYRIANDPSAVSFGEAVSGVQAALRDMIGRQNPAQAARLRQINEGYANLVRIEKAAGSTASQATEGVFSPTQLGVAAAQGAGRSSRANEGALLQDLAVAGRSVLPNRIGDSGTATRGAVTGLLAGGATLVNPTVAIPSITLAMAAYSKPALAALNAIYRATDRGAATAQLARLQRMASQNPALQGQYEAAARHVLESFGNPSPRREPRATGLLSPTGP